MIFLVVITATREIAGNQMTFDTVVPSSPPGVDYVAVDETDPLVIAAIDTLSWPKNGPLRWRWDGTQPQEIPDPRFPVRVTQTPKPGLIGSALTVKLEVLNAAGNLRTGLNRQATVQYVDQARRLRRARLNIVAGAAERTFTPSESGELELVSDSDQVVFQGDNPVLIDEAW